MRKIIIAFLLLSIILFSCKHESKEFYFSSEKEFLENNEGLSDTALVGKLIFFDKNLSNPVGVNCATCHSPMVGFSDPRHTSFSEGSAHQHGTRNAPAISYMGFAPNKRNEPMRGIWEAVGGFFWDGRAEILNQQALFPLTNPIEMNNKGFGMVADKIKQAPYYPKLEKLFGKEHLTDSQTVVFYAVMCLQKFQTSSQVSPFTSKFDFYLKGKAKLSTQEMRGMQLFNDTIKVKCSLCHLTKPTSYASSDKILFTDYSYDNIGLPKNPELKGTPVDSGASKFEFKNPLEVGRFKAPTLRNIAVTYPYMHSGIFNSLDEVVEFYNERDVHPEKFGPPEVPQTMNKEFMGNLKLSKQDMSDIVSFLKTLTDGYKP